MSSQRAKRSRPLTQKQLEEALDESDEEPCSYSSSEWEPSDEEECSELEDHLSNGEELESDSEESQPEANTESSETILSKDRSIQWSLEPPIQRGRFPGQHVVNLTPGPTRFATSRVGNDETSAFFLFFTPAIKNIILENTNLEGRRAYENNWKALDVEDLHAYLGLLILAGVFKSHNEATESLWDAEKGRSIFRATMSLEFFKKISRVIRFDNKSTRNERRARDKFAAIRELWDKWVEILPALFNPEENVTVDEQLVAFRGKCAFRQYMPNKPARYGIKFWILCDNVTSYVWNIQPYIGKPADQPREQNQGMRVVLDLTCGLKGHNVTCDNFFTSHQLGQMLLKRKISMIGTIRKNKGSIPPELLQTKNVPKYTSKFAFTSDTTLVSYRPEKTNKCVVLQSTLHHSKEISNTEKKKPQIILDYNKTKGSVDTMDKAVACYTTKRKTNRWPLIVFYNILDISAFNAYVLYTKINSNWQTNNLRKRRIFLENLGMSLVKPQMQRRTHLPRNKPARYLVTSTKCAWMCAP